MKRNIIVTETAALLPDEQPVEIVERKGIGHPDTLCDGIAERIAVEYVRWCREHGGVLLHHNFDKVQLVAGEVDVHFGGGEMLKPIRIQIAGRGTRQTPDGRAIPVDLIAINAAKTYLRQTMRHLDPDRHCVIDCYAGRGAGELAQTVAHVTANDTSAGVAHWPFSRLETAVYQTCQAINQEMMAQFPIGEDVKVMGARLNDDLAFTCAVPFLASEVHNLAQYRSLKTAVQQAISAYARPFASGEVQVQLNMADDEEAGDVYLTLTGSSGEQGDDGAVGRGNRITGLITPFRPSSLEATAGKNAISHVGKLYNVLALAAARAIVEQVTAVRQAQVFILSQIGQPLARPFVVTAVVQSTAEALPVAARREVEEVLANCLDQLDGLREALIDGNIPLF
ncbi:MAG: methionine adenosyltransferase [Anaerolineae bacterium]|nr:methionine adenosyltransferase [Anaerolineae bacterium]